MMRFFLLIFLAFDFCRFRVVIPFFIPATTANDLWLRRIYYPRFYLLHLFSYLNSWERASIFSFECSVLNKGTTWYHFYNVFGMTRSLTGDWTWDLPAIDASLQMHWNFNRNIQSAMFDCMYISFVSYND